MPDRSNGNSLPPPEPFILAMVTCVAPQLTGDAMGNRQGCTSTVHNRHGGRYTFSRTKYKIHHRNSTINHLSVLFVSNMPPKLPKRKRKFGRNQRTNRNQKQSRFDYANARELAGSETANSQQLVAAANPPVAKSPLKSVYKERLKEEEAKTAQLSKQVEKLQKQGDLQKKKVLSLSSALRDERNKSRLAVSKLLNDAECIVAEANDVKIAASKEVLAANTRLDHELTRQKKDMKKAKAVMIKESKKVRAEAKQALKTEKRRSADAIERERHQYEIAEKSLVNEKESVEKALAKEQAHKQVAVLRERHYGSIAIASRKCNHFLFYI